MNWAKGLFKKFRKLVYRRMGGLTLRLIQWTHITPWVERVDNQSALVHIMHWHLSDDNLWTEIEIEISDRDILPKMLKYMMQP